MCNGCVDVCPTACLALVPLSEINVEPHLEKLFQQRYGVNVNEYAQEKGEKELDELGSVMLKDEELCIRCGYCAKRCPTEAVTMEHYSYTQTFSWED